MVEAHKWGVQQNNQKWQPARGYERHPIINVSWYGANEYCNWLKQETGEDYQLPDEWYWEWAARSGQKSQGYQYAGSNDIEEVAWYKDNSYDKGGKHPDYGTHRVGEKKANELGLYDMSGNVWEWCRNEWEGKERLRVVRGGSWINYDYICAVSFRDGYYTDYGYNLIGVRVSRY